MRSQTFAMGILLIASVSLHLTAYAAKCASDEVKTGEDANNIYCTKKAEIECVKRVGKESSAKQTQVQCAKRVEQVTKSLGYALSKTAATCLGSCTAAYIKKGDRVSTVACLTACSLTAIQATEVMDKVVEEQNTCFEQANAKQQKDLQECKK